MFTSQRGQGSEPQAVCRLVSHSPLQLASQHGIFLPQERKLSFLRRVQP
jgi:hypothetical protein